MGILIKYTFRNIKEHKFRTFLILLSIMLSVGLFFASLSISDALTDLIMENIKSYIGTAEVYAGPGRFNDSGSIKMKELGDVSEDVEYAIGVVEWGVKYRNSEDKTQTLNLKGYRLEDLEIQNPVNFVKSLGPSAYTGKTAIVGQAFAEKEGYELGDFVPLIFSDDDIKRFKIVAIAENKGFFKENMTFGEKNPEFIVPRETLSRFLGSPNLVNTVYFKTVDDTKMQETIEKIKTVYKDEYVGEMISKSEIKSQVDPIRIPFMFMLILVVLISVFIIYTSFKVITLERLPMLGTFRSIGATKKMTDFIMLSEATIYGVLGSGIGCWLGYGMLTAVTHLMSSSMLGGGTVERIVYPPLYMVLAFVFGMILSFGSALVPIVKTSKIPIKEILLNIIEGTKKKRKYMRYVIGVILAALSILIPILMSEGMMAALSGGLGIILMIFALVCFVPALSDGFITISERFFAAVFGNIGMLAVKNMRGNKSTYDNVILLTIGLASMLTISTMGAGMQNDLLEYFNTRTYDLEVYVDSESSQTTVQRILSIEGIEDTMIYQNSYSAFTYQGDEKPFLNQLVGISTDRFANFVQYDILNHDNDREIFEDVLTGRKLILGTTIRDKYNLKEGQVLDLDTGRGIRKYEIIGFIKTKDSDGKIGITSRRNIKNDLKQFWGTTMAMKIKPGYDIDQMKVDVEEKLKNLDWYRVEVMKELKERYMQQNSTFIIIISAFSVATALIGSIGVMNNFLVSFLARKKALAIYASVGMSKKQRKQMILIEAISGGIMGAVFGIATTQLMMFRVSNLLEKAEISLGVNMTMSSAMLGMIGAVSVCLISSLGVLKRSGKVSIIEELRYE